MRLLLLDCLQTEILSLLFMLELWNHETFKTGRQNAIDELSKLLTPKSSSSSSSSTRAPKRKTILVDDIMHLKSMRKQVFQLCRHHSVPLVTVCVSTSLTTALQRNQTRNIDTTVSEESIRKLFDEFEVPDPRFVHDRHVIPIDTTHEPM